MSFDRQDEEICFVPTIRKKNAIEPEALPNTNDVANLTWVKFQIVLSLQSVYDSLFLLMALQKMLVIIHDDNFKFFKH